MNIEVLYSDSSIVVINKPHGLLSVPGRGKNKQNSAASQIIVLFKDCIPQPSVHRLDMDTSGLMVFALTKDTHRDLSIQFQNSEVKKEYIAVLDGLLAPELGDNGTIKLKFRLNPDNRPYQIYDPENGKEGITEWKRIDQKNNQSRILFTPKTGRSHQLRLHSAQPVKIINKINKGGLGCPILGDRLYGSSTDKKHEQGERMLLHASKLEFIHPVSKKHMFFTKDPDF
ncbi:MAG: RluA family pseudouridine synthase [Spirochaetales bacterium]|nr:RluA family pseudouridine synthase [Spirochaetales bacterium]